jgi:hypothetical protein
MANVADVFSLAKCVGLRKYDWRDSRQGAGRESWESSANIRFSVKMKGKTSRAIIYHRYIGYTSLLSVKPLYSDHPYGSVMRRTVAAKV